MKQFLLLLSLLALGVRAQVPEQSEAIMLQGFYWNSQTETGWQQLLDHVPALSSTFTHVWLPPSASAEGGGAVGGTNVGYHPRVWNDQTSCWGTAAQLKALIAAFHEHGVQVLADVVVNHRAGYTSWGNFPLDDFGTYGSYQLTADHICSTDEMNTDPSAGSWYGKAKGAPDSGENWGGARDLDHTSAQVQHAVTAYLKWLRGDVGYDGFRYDFVKGFAAQYVGQYNREAQPTLSVGEYWDGSYDNVWAWIKNTGYASMAFDFPMKYAALNNGLARGNYAAMAWAEDNATWRPAGLIHHHQSAPYAVTFVDNHDTYRNSDKFGGYVEQAYAFLFSSAGIPCVFWPHWTQYGTTLARQAAVRRAAGLHAACQVEVTQRSTYYESLATGLRGTLITRIGAAAPTDVPTGYYLAASGTGWSMYLSDGTQGITAQPQARPAQVSLIGGRLSVQADGTRRITLYDAAGRQLHSVSAAHLTLSLPHGTYVLCIEGAAPQRLAW